MKDIAVIMPVYNTAEYLHRSIGSILSQRGVNLELLIINDGSTDYSENIIKYYVNKVPRVIYTQKQNEGQGIARNIGIQQSNAKYLYFVDSDDYLEGEYTLKILFDTSEQKNLDICSPDVLPHYFEYPLEMTPCLPSKAQFIRSSIIKNFSIFQPNIRSGQDGVFSHLVLTHCTRIGMNKRAKYFYTHAREGSTFTQHLKRSDLVAKIIEQHYAAIEEHYDKFNLWEKNALRLLLFIEKETIKNRMVPHWNSLNKEDKLIIFLVLKRVYKRCLMYIPNEEFKDIKSRIDKILLFSDDYIINKLNPIDLSLKLPSQSANFMQQDILICKYFRKEYEPENTITNLAVEDMKKASSPTVNRANDYDTKNLAALYHSLSKEDNNTNKTINLLSKKIDFLINQINNLFIQQVSLHNTGYKTLKNGIGNLMVSLTTLPSRLPLVHLAIESIFQQTILPSKIVLWLSNTVDLCNALTPELKNLQQRGLEIKQVKDVGPHTKLVYAYNRYQDYQIITIDDDIIYPNNMIQFLWKEHLKFPNSIIANWARELSFDEEGNVLGIRKGKLLTPPLLQTEIEQKHSFFSCENIRAFPYGTGGVLYPPNSLHQDFKNIQLFSKLCPKEDDIWFKAMSLLNGTKVVTTNLGINPEHHCILGSQDIALRHHNHGEGQNEKQMQLVFNHFKLARFFKNS